MAMEGEGAAFALDDADPPIRVGEVSNLSGEIPVGQVSKPSTKTPGKENGSGAYIDEAWLFRQAFDHASNRRSRPAESGGLCC